MWIKMDNSSYFDTDNSVILGAAGVADSFHVEAVTPYTGGRGRKLRSGYATLEDAQDALDALMTEVGYEEVPAPAVVPFDSEEDDESDYEEVSYEDMSVDDLKAECAGRTPPLSTNGKKADLIERLRQDDATRETEQSSVV